ncbi:hypothetical protein [Brevibacterium yomogidense]|uniref:hypothetical protein n=1 Tax=Brevibacterium yomogidense TaxID=946573 RepID=UPI0018DFD1BB|nr:hypothetical protein [Brevibacterium yomogidense]
MAAMQGGSAETSSTPPDRAHASFRRVVAWSPGTDTLIAAATLVVFWGCYWAGTTVNEWFLLAGVIVVGTLIPAWTVLQQRGEGLEGLGIRRRFLVVSLIIAGVMGAGSAYQLFTLAAAQDVAVLPHLVGNLLVFWEPLFVFGWLYLRWERAFGWLPAILLTGAGFVLQHIGSVPFEAALGFGGFAVVFAIAFACVRNLAILWPLFYPVASGIGTLQAGFVMGWSSVGSGALLLAVQGFVLAGVWWTVHRK